MAAPALSARCRRGWGAAPHLRRGLGLLLLGIGLLASPGAAGADPLQRARTQYREMEYEAVVRLTGPLLRGEGLSVSQRVETLELLGLSQLILGRQEPARRAFEALLALAPDHRLSDPSGSPKLQRFFEQVRREAGLGGAAGPTLHHHPPSRAQAGQTVTLRVRAPGAPSDARLLLHFQLGGGVSWQERAARRDDGGFAAALPLPGAAGGELRYYFELRSSGGETLARLGRPGAPLRLTLDAGGAGRPIYKRWWFWTAVGAVVAGSVTAAVLATAGDTVPGGTLAPGVVTLR